MRGMFGLVGILLTLALVGILVKKQLVPVAGGVAPQSAQIQQQVKQSLEAALQPVRAEPTDK